MIINRIHRGQRALNQMLNGVENTPASAAPNQARMQFDLLGPHAKFRAAVRTLRDR